ncbi:hypothetical protein C495_08680 [Natronorubrum sulfidifaciens JCM 14089]|uniref:DUF5305 domain-containing protein n=1 Tax=Natronorubrum sulfidifaciens JCM 14089 TaxID=1230460 RepID=L9W9M5_9EURY|nr:hypothetical protein C495_08680 [Natronorubrum sulfidifaciens JCM 14089]
MLAQYGRLVAIALVVIGALALVATGWAVANPTTETTTQYGDDRVESDVQTSAVVVRDGELWSEGERLENSRVYALNATPELTLEPETRLVNEETNTPIDDAAVSHELVFRFEAVRDGDPFWNETHTVIDESPAVENGIAASTATIDVESYRDRQRQLERELSGIGSVDLEVEFRAEYDTSRTQGTQQASTAFHVTDDAYWLAESLATADEHTYQVGTAQTTESRSLGTIAGLSLLGTLSIVGAAFVARRAPVDEDAARRAVHEKRYAEWISRGSIPMWVGDYHISLDTLEDVVDVAIDTNERVVNDRQRGLFAVVTDDVVYYYSDRGLWEETAWPELNLTKQSQPPDDTPAFSPDELEFDGEDEFADPAEDGFEDDEDVWKQL